MYRVILPVLLLCFGCTDKPLKDPELLEFTESVKADDIRHHIAVLADDSLKGRLPGTPEYDVAMRYVADFYSELGLKPLGDNGSYFQQVTLRKAMVDESKSFMLLNGDTLEVGDDYFYLGNPKTKAQFSENEIAFVGTGIYAGELGRNDFEGLDVAGKVVMVMMGTPDSLFQPSEQAYFGNIRTKIQTAGELGASGILFVMPSDFFNGAYERQKRTGTTNVILASGETGGFTSPTDNLNFLGMINDDIVEKVMQTSMDSIMDQFESGTLRQPEREIRLTSQIASTWSEFESANVLGLLEGGDLKAEYIVHTAHLDHIGIGVPVDGDSIYNGAHDNASGVSSMLEIARLYANLDSKPRRSIIFAAVTAEEMGLLGSLYLAKNPPVPKSQIVANVNTDMPTLIAPILSIEPLGAEHSSIMSHVEHSAGLLGLQIDEDHAPNEVRFVRSDNINFILEGIPALRMKYGLKTADSETGLKEMVEEFTSQVYHKPSDQLDAWFDFEAARTYVKLQFMNSYFINITDAPPHWNEDSFFRRFKK